MKSILVSVVIGLAASANAAVNYSSTVAIPTTATQVKLESAEYKLIPTKTETRKIPGCVETSENYGACSTEVVLESEAAVVANVSYVDSFASENEVSWSHVNLNLNQFSDVEVQALKAAFPRWKHPFSRAGEKFAKKNLSLTVKNVSREIQVVDMKKSVICPTNDSGDVLGNCTEKLVYKTVVTSGKEISVLRK